MTSKESAWLPPQTKTLSEPSSKDTSSWFPSEGPVEKFIRVHKILTDNPDNKNKPEPININYENAGSGNFIIGDNKYELTNGNVEISPVTRSALYLFEKSDILSDPKPLSALDMPKAEQDIQTIKIDDLIEKLLLEKTQQNPSEIDAQSIVREEPSQVITPQTEQVNLNRISAETILNNLRHLADIVGKEPEKIILTQDENSDSFSIKTEIASFRFHDGVVDSNFINQNSIKNENFEDFHDKLIDTINKAKQKEETKNTKPNQGSFKIVPDIGKAQEGSLMYDLWNKGPFPSDSPKPSSLQGSKNPNTTSITV